jgi:hypothetical protein
LSRENQAITKERLNISGMLKNHSLAHLQRMKPGKEDRKELFTQMCGRGSWQAWQLEDLISMMPLRGGDIKNLLDTASYDFRFELFQPRCSKKQDRTSLFRLVEGLKRCPGNLPALAGSVSNTFLDPTG